MTLRSFFSTLFLASTLCAGAAAQAPAAPQQSPAARPATPSAPAAAAPAQGQRVSPSKMAAAPGGGPGQVWVNTASKVYHCPGSTYYGKTKAGKYMAEDAAKAEGDRANGGKPCAK